MSLLDQNITKYFLKWKGSQGQGFGFKDCKIQKEDGEQIGKLETEGQPGGPSKKNYLYDNENLVLFTTKSNWSLGGKYYIKDSENNQIAIVKGKALSRKRNFTMKNLRGDKILTFKSFGVLEDRPHEINSIDGKNIAKFSVKVEYVKQSDWGQAIPNNCSCTLQIIDSNFNRKILLGMFISCLSSYIDFVARKMN